MGVKRHKHMKKVLNFYKTHFNFDLTSINVLIDGTFAHEALKSKVNLAEQVPNYFEMTKNKCKLFTTKCAINEVEKLGSTTYGAMLILKQYELVECTHSRTIVNTEKCFKDLVLHSKQANNGTSQYIVASQSNSLKEIVRNVPGVPLLILSHSALNLENPKQMTLNVVNEAQDKKINLNDVELGHIQKLKGQLLPPQQQEPIFKRKKAKGPNPLSCLKSKKKKTSPNNNKIPLTK